MGAPPPLDVNQDVAAEESEAELMRQVAAGEIGGLETLYDRHHAMAYALALRITTEPGLAEDVVQDSFLGLWRNAGRYAEAKGSVRGWLLAIVRHRAIDTIRRQKKGVTLDDDTTDIVPAALTLPDIWPEVAGRLDAEEIRVALEGLPSAQREAIEFAYFDGLTQREIATRTGAPLGTVKSRMRLGLVALRRELLEVTDVIGARRSI
ncbi:MAG TPA: sigma-70 family RNA polymerase sigma factor [Candidatus Limnocylindrales bacterium]|jgi:RNA polymerase sigma factor (sigma-70 family)